MREVQNDKINGTNVGRVFCYYCKKLLWIQVGNDFIKKNDAYLKMCKNKGASMNVCKECFNEKNDVNKK